MQQRFITSDLHTLSFPGIPHYVVGNINTEIQRELLQYIEKTRTTFVLGLTAVFSCIRTRPDVIAISELIRPFEIGWEGVDWILLPQDGDQWPVL
jgi:hypothetical protein